MWTLSAPDISSTADELRLALTRADGTSIYAPTVAQLAALLEIYSQYDAKSGHPSSLLFGANLGSDFLSVVNDAYGQVQQGGRLAALRERLKAEIPQCPYCGFGEIRELDHHLPRVSFRALAIYPRNLIPCCSMCNNKKRAVVGDAPSGQFAHVYFEEIPPARFLIASIEVSSEGIVPSFSIQRCAGMTDAVFDRLSFQFSRLELNRRYQAQVTTLLQSHRMSIEDAASAGGNSLFQWLERAKTSMRAEFGLNDWRAALFDGLANSPAFYHGGFRLGFRRRSAAPPPEVVSGQ
jgi:hypothetical protein